MRGFLLGEIIDYKLKIISSIFLLQSELFFLRIKNFINFAAKNFCCMEKKEIILILNWSK